MVVLCILTLFFFFLLLIFSLFTVLPAFVPLFPVNTKEELYSILMDITDENSNERGELALRK